MDIVTYEQAIERCSEVIDNKHHYGVDFFGCSTALALVFRKTKEQTADDLLEYRRIKEESK